MPRTLATILLTLITASAAAAAELVMFEEPGCIWCQRWHTEIGPGYGKSEEGRIAPLRVVDIRHGPPQGLRLERAVTMTPTFVLVEDGAEVGRLVGYPGAHFFYPMLAEQLKKLQQKAIPPSLPAQRDAHASDRQVIR
jgi:hypothetical protein